MFRPAVLGGMWGWRDGSLKNEVNTRGYRNPRIPPHPPNWTLRAAFHAFDTECPPSTASSWPVM